MSSRSDSPSSSRVAVGDLVVVALGAILALAAVLFDWPAFVRVPVGIIAVLILPGYAVAAALFPAGSTTLADGREPTAAGISLLERGVLSIAISLAAVILTGMNLDWLLGGIGTGTLVAGVATISLVASVLAAVRRRYVRPEDRYTPSISLTTGRPRTARHTALAALLVVSVLFAGGAVATSVMNEGGSAGLTEFYFVSDSEDGEDSYPTTFVRERPRSFSLAVTNSEGSETEYTIVGELQAVEQQNGTPVVVEGIELSREQLTVATGDTRQFETTVEPTAEPGRYRLVYMLYRGDAPRSPELSTAYREIHLWIEITDESTDDTG